MAERSVLELIRESLEKKLFPPPPTGYIGEVIHRALLKKITKEDALLDTGRPIEEPKKEKDGD